MSGRPNDQDKQQGLWEEDSGQSDAKDGNCMTSQNSKIETRGPDHPHTAQLANPPTRQRGPPGACSIN